METCLNDFKGIKRICLWLALLFCIMFGAFFWTTQLNGLNDIGINKFDTLQYMQKLKSSTLNRNQLDMKQNNLSLATVLNTPLSSTLRSITLHNKTNLPNKQDWWNIDTSFTICEEKLLGWKQSSDKLTTFNPNNKDILCRNNDLSNDLRHAHIECYDRQWRGTHICILKNIYGYITSAKNLKFKAFCNQALSKKTEDCMQKIKKNFNSKNTENIHFPLHLDLIDDTENRQQLKINGVEYKDNNNDIWYYDNSHQCEWHKKNDKSHIGNPWHCFGHIEYWFGIAYLRNITKENYNITVVQSQFTDNQFGPKEAIYHFYDAFFENVINKNILNQIYEPGEKLFYIKELIIDERIARDWGMSVLWQHKVKAAFNRRCPDTQINRRSPIFYEMRKQMMNYYEMYSEYTDYDWVGDILRISGQNKWIIHGDLNDLAGKKLVFIGTRYVNNRCRYRCIANGPGLKDAFLDLFNSINDEFVVIYGNPGVLSFYCQYNLFKNTRIFIGVHGAVFLMGSLFMPPWSLKFELTMPYNLGQPKQLTSEDIVAYFDNENEESYGNYFCKMCVIKAAAHPSNVDKNKVIDAFIKKFLCFIYGLCDKDDIVSYIRPGLDRLLHYGSDNDISSVENEASGNLTLNETVDEELKLIEKQNISVVMIEKQRDNGTMNDTHPFTECEQKYLGWDRNSFGDLSFEKTKRHLICENEDVEKDKRHMNMECWHVYDNKGKNYVCIIKNLYGFRSDDNKLHFEGFCKHETRAIANGIMTDIYNAYNGKDPELVKYPLYLNIINDEINKDQMVVDGVEYKENNKDLWYYDNCHQCESHKMNDSEHIGNPWHCFGHIEYYYHIAHRLGITINKYNTTVIMSQFTDYQFGPNIPIYHFFTPFYKNIINKQVVETLNDERNMFYIKEMILDHRNAKGWGYGTIWKGNNVKAFDNDDSCQEKNLRRSPIMLEMKRDMTLFYDTNPFYSDYDWIKELESFKGVNKWEINGNIDRITHDKTVKLVLIVTRWMNGICRYRCISNGNELKNKLIELLGNDKYIFIYGNPGSASFRAQYHLFKNTNIFIGVHGAVFLMSSMFMEINTFQFEILMGESKNKVANSLGVVSMFGGRQFYKSYYCNNCKFRRGQTPSKIDINEVSEKVMIGLQQIYQTS